MSSRIPKISPISIRESKTELFEQFARVAKALASGVRLEVLDLLAQKEYSVEALAEVLGQSLQNMSRHLQVLRQVKLVNSRKEGNFVHYRLSNRDVSDLVSRLQAVSHRHLAEVKEVLDRFQSHAAEFEVIELDQLLERAERGELIVLDVRPSAEFTAGHLPKAKNLPLGQLESKLSELPRDKPVVAYCRGKYCLLAYAAVDYLRQKGLEATRLDEGIIEWRLREQPLETG